MTKKTLINKNFEDQYLMTSQRVFSQYKQGHFHCPGKCYMWGVNLNINLYECFSGHLS